MVPGSNRDLWIRLPFDPWEQGRREVALLFETLLPVERSVSVQFVSLCRLSGTKCLQSVSERRKPNSSKVVGFR